MALGKWLQKSDPKATTHRPGDFRGYALPGEKLHCDLVSHASSKAALQLQAAQREINNPYCLEATVAVNQDRNPGRMALVAPTNRRSLVVT